MRVLRGRSATCALVLLLGVTAACSGGSSRSSSTAPKPERIVYVALGDSYSSGEGAPPYRHDGADAADCARSDLSWPGRLHTDVDTVTSFAFVACSGAESSALTGPWTDRRLPPQIPTTPDPTVTLVTFTVGGNDIGFQGIVAACFLLDCSGVPTNGLFTRALADLEHHLTAEVYPALRRAYPNARIVHVGYPVLTPAAGQPVRGCAWLSAKEQPAAVLIVQHLDSAIRDAARQSMVPGGAKVEYADIAGALRAHELCSAAPWVHPVTLTGSAQAHPTPAGQRALELAVAQALGLRLR